MACFVSSALLAVLLLISQVSCYNTKPVDRRTVARNVGFLVAGAPLQNANAVLSSGFCAQGVGEGCEDRAEGNEYIKSLQQKSAANREANAKEALNSFYQRNYPDVFAVTGKTMVKKADGTFAVFSDEEMDQLRKENKIGIEIAKAKGGKYTDLTQRRLLILKE